jgi:hypothetical protein
VVAQTIRRNGHDKNPSQRVPSVLAEIPPDKEPDEGGRQMRKCRFQGSFEDRLAVRKELNFCDLRDVQRKEVQRILERMSDDTYYRGGYRE